MKDNILKFTQTLKEKYPRIIQSLIGLFFVCIFLSLLWKGLFVTTSSQGFISTQVFSLRSPILGTLNINPGVEAGALLPVNQQLFQVNGSPDVFMDVADMKEQGVTVAMPFEAGVWSVLANSGELVKQGDEIVQLIRADKMVVDGYFEEKLSPDLKIGRSVTVKLLNSDKSWKGKIKFVRAGIDRINPYLVNTLYKYDIHDPPATAARRLVDAEIEVQWDGYFTAKEFYGLGRNVVVVLN